MNNDQKYITIKKASKNYGVSAQLFRKWEGEGHIKSLRTPGNVRMFAIADIEQILSIDSTSVASKVSSQQTKNFIYCRVSSRKQSNDLVRQSEYLQSVYPQHTVISDICSGINFTRKGLSTILDAAMQGIIGEVVVAYKDRLARFGFELIEQIIQKGGGKVVILNNNIYKSSEQELAEDLLAIIHVFNCKQMGKRRYSTKNIESSNLSE